METNLEVPESGKEIQRQSDEFPERARRIALAITDDVSYQGAGQFLTTIKGFRKQIEEAFGPVVQKAYSAWKGICELRKKADAPLDEAEQIIKQAMSSYYVEQERKRKAEQDAANAKLKKQEEEARISRASELEKNGEKSAAEATLGNPTPMPPVILPKVERLKGVAMAEVWKIEVVNLMELAQAVSTGMVPLSALKANEEFLRQQARSLKSDFNYPGVRAWPESQVRARAEEVKK